ncbi:MAG: orotidine-5'-phosphate decarboxylase [Nanoarchaeota archaeon]|nr:orotidine-5'-phosphate decarboxylase [Nanoarchaeota archaeon]
MTYLDLLRTTTERTGSIICVGLDPVLEKIPIKGNPEKVITKFYTDLFEAFQSENVLPGAIKPNIAFYEQYGFEGLRALQNVITIWRAANIPIILDAKRGDIGKTSAAYAKACFVFWNVDAVTVAPYMGSDSIAPFLHYADRGVYVLCRTSNPGAGDIQDLLIEGVPLYQKVADQLLQWAQLGTGAVLGATYPEELENIATQFTKSGKELPLLIPGIGGQGGTVEEIMRSLKHAAYPLPLCRINASSAVNYAYQKQDTDDYAGAAVIAFKQIQRNAVIRQKTNK